MDTLGRGRSSNIEDNRGKRRDFALPSPPKLSDFPNTPEGNLAFEMADAAWRGSLIDAMYGNTPERREERAAWRDRVGEGVVTKLTGNGSIITGGSGNNTLRGGAGVDKRVIDTIIAEALGEGTDGMTAVAYTILNRANNRGLTPLQVVKQKAQYSGYSNPGSSVARAMSDPQVRARVEAIWNKVQTGAVPDPTQGGEYFHTTNISPSWSKGVNRNGKTTIGNHVFYLGKGQANPVSPAVPGRRPETAVAAIDKALGRDMGVSGLGYAPPSGRLTAQAQPKLTEQVLTEWAQGYVPTNQRSRTRTVNTISVTPDSPLAGNVPDLQTALNRVAETRRRAMTGADPVVDPNASEIVRRIAANANYSLKAPATMEGTDFSSAMGGGRGTNVLSGAIDPLGPRLGKLALSPATQDWMSSNAIPRGPGSRGRKTSLPPLTGSGGINAFVGNVDRLSAPTALAAIEGATNPYSGSPVFGKNPNLMRLTPEGQTALPEPPALVKPPIGDPKKYASAARLAAMGGRLPSDTMFGWMPGLSQALEQEALQTANAFGYADADGKTRLPAFTPSSLNPGNSLLGRLIGRFNVNAFARDAQKRAKKGTALANAIGSFVPGLGNFPAMSPRDRGNSARDGLSGAQIDIAERQSRGDPTYQSLIEWAMRS